MPKRANYWRILYTWSTQPIKFGSSHWHDSIIGALVVQCLNYAIVLESDCVTHRSVVSRCHWCVRGRHREVFCWTSTRLHVHAAVLPRRHRTDLQGSSWDSCERPLWPTSCPPSDHVATPTTQCPNTSNQILISMRPIHALIHSGVTRVGVTRGGDWRCHPIFSWKKTGDIFWSSVCHFYWFHSGVTPLERVTQHHFSPVRPPLYANDIICFKDLTPLR